MAATARRQLQEGHWQEGMCKEDFSSPSLEEEARVTVSFAFTLPPCECHLANGPLAIAFLPTAVISSLTQSADKYPSPPRVRVHPGKTVRV